MKGKKILITGGTGSFGNAFTEYLLKTKDPEVIRIYSRDELKQAEMQKRFGNNPKLRFIIGDVRDYERTRSAMRGVDIVFHAAALKRIEAAEYNAFEAVKTNILGTQNVIEASLKENVEKVVALSTDKAVAPLNLYGATKLCLEKIVTQGNMYVGERRTKLSCIRYGNVAGSRGSVIPLFLAQGNEITVTDPRMTRFIITLDEAIEFVSTCTDMMQGGEIFVPKIPSAKIMLLASRINPDAIPSIVGIRPGEKLHEVMITAEESRQVTDIGDRYVVNPQFIAHKNYEQQGTPVRDGFRYASNENNEWIDLKRLDEIIDSIRKEIK